MKSHIEIHFHTVRRCGQIDTHILSAEDTASNLRVLRGLAPMFWRVVATAGRVMRARPRPCPPRSERRYTVQTPNRNRTRYRFSHGFTFLIGQGFDTVPCQSSMRRPSLRTTKTTRLTEIERRVIGLFGAPRQCSYMCLQVLRADTACHIPRLWAHAC